MQWTSDVAAGDWLRERVDAQWQPPYTMHMTVPRGFEAYARILHPATRDRFGAELAQFPLELRADSSAFVMH